MRLAREFVVAVGPLLREVVLAMFRDGIAPQRAGLLAQLTLGELVEAEDAATFMPLPGDPRARRVADLILANPAGRRELADLAAAAGASGRTITRLFPAETDLTFKEWRQRARILAAVEALSGGHVPVKEVSVRLGFSSAAAFGHAFRQVIGMTPSAFASLQPWMPDAATGGSSPGETRPGHGGTYMRMRSVWRSPSPSPQR